MISRIYLAALFTCMVSSVQVKPDNKRYENACKKFGMNSYFDPKLVLGPQWRIYYTWNSIMNTNCLAIKFHVANPWLIHSFYKGMGEYLMQQPTWKSAVFYATIGSTKDELLLLATKGPAGKFHGVLNLVRDPTLKSYIKKKSVPLITFQLKLLQGGRYLVIMNCLGGLVTLSTRYTDEPPSRFEIESVAKSLALGNGSLTCKTTKDKSDSLLLALPNYDMK